MNSTFEMTGTTGTSFTGISQTSAGRLGFRSLAGEDENGSFRIRVEPAPGKTLGLNGGWNQPGDSPRTQRYSKVVSGAVEFAATIAEAQKALDVASVVYVPEHVEVKTIEVVVPASITIQ